MFLNALSVEDKPKFLGLLYIVAKSDGAIEECEISHISAYAGEMGIENNDNNSESFENIINYFKSRPETIRKIVIAEVLALAHIDGKFCSAEKMIIENIDKKFSLPKNFKNEILEWVNDIQPLYANGFKLVGLI